MVRDLYREYAPMVYSLAYRVVQDHGLAEEATQTTFLNAWRHAADFDPDREMGPWLYTIARRAAIDIYRRERRHRAGPASEAEMAVLPKSMDETWRAWQVQLALRALPGEELEVIRCTHYLGLTHEQTAERLGIPAGTVKSRSHRAYRRLAAILSDLAGEVAG